MRLLLTAKMGGCMSSNSDEVEQKKTNQAIDKMIEEDKKRLRKEIKLLLLGVYSRDLIRPPKQLLTYRLRLR